MQNTDKLKARVGYAGKSQQWQYGFDLACREKQTEIERLKLENMNLRAQRDKVIQDCAMLELDLIKQKRKPPEPPLPPAGPDTRKFRTAADLLPPNPPEPKYTY